MLIIEKKKKKKLENILIRRRILWDFKMDLDYDQLREIRSRFLSCSEVSLFERRFIFKC